MKAVTVLFRYQKAPVISHQSLLFSSLDESVFLSLSLQSKCYSPWNHLAGLMLNLFQLCARSLSSGNLVKISTTQNVLLCPARWVDCTNLSSDGHHLSKGKPVFHSYLIFAHALLARLQIRPHTGAYFGKKQVVCFQLKLCKY